MWDGRCCPEHAVASRVLPVSGVAVKIQRSESLKAVYKALNCRIEMDPLVTKPNRRATAGRNFLAAGRNFLAAGCSIEFALVLELK